MDLALSLPALTALPEARLNPILFIPHFTSAPLSRRPGPSSRFNLWPFQHNWGTKWVSYWEYLPICVANAVLRKRSGQSIESDRQCDHLRWQDVFTVSLWGYFVRWTDIKFERRSLYYSSVSLGPVQHQCNRTLLPSIIQQRPPYLPSPHPFAGLLCDYPRQCAHHYLKCTAHFGRLSWIYIEVWDWRSSDTNDGEYSAYLWLDDHYPEVNGDYKATSGDEEGMVWGFEKDISFPVT